MSLATFLDQIITMSTNAYRAGRGRRLHADNPQFWDELPERVLNEAPCAFVLSTGRCGTQFLTRMLRGCGNVDVNHHAELTSELQFPSRIAYESAVSGEDQGLELAALCSRFEPIQTSFLSQRVFVETNNRITFLAPYLQRLFKKARFLHLVRNPASFVRSGVNAGFYAGGYYDTGRIRPVEVSNESSWESYSQLKKVAWLWNATNQFAEDFKETVRAEQVMTVRSEDLFKETNVARQVVEFLGGRALTEKAIKRLAARKVNAGVTGGLPASLQDWDSQDQQDLRQVCPLAKVYNYTLARPAGNEASVANTKPLHLGQNEATPHLTNLSNSAPRNRISV